jgi:2OG-Fe(II) oxygenase superfamily
MVKPLRHSFSPSLTLTLFFAITRYAGRQGEETKQFPSAMEEACKIVEKTVNAEMCKRKRFPLEWGGDPGDPNGQGLTWRANFAAANCYEGAKETVGFHSDRLTSIGPYPTIASLSLGTCCSDLLF